MSALSGAAAICVIDGAVVWEALIRRGFGFEREVGGERIDALREDVPLGQLCGAWVGEGIDWSQGFLCGEMTLMIDTICF